MRCLALVTLALIPLAGCSGLGQFEGDTLTRPGANPTLPAGASETMLRVQAKETNVAPLEPEPGDVWPGQPKPFPTLGEVEHQTQAAGQTSAGVGGSATGGALPPPPGGQRFEMKSNANAASTIVIPNGNGTSTVISPDGAVHIVPTPKAGAPSGPSSSVSPSGAPPGTTPSGVPSSTTPPGTP